MTMTLQDAIRHIRECAAAMQQDYGRPVFDELAVVRTAGPRSYLAWYEGPRQDEFVRNYSGNIASLRAELRSRFTGSATLGDFEFAHDGASGECDAIVAVGDGLYLICGNTTQTVADITRDERWRVAQAQFLELCERFRADPLVWSGQVSAPVFLN
jgi:hypothetical protein